jgi:hypothetical protein
MSNQKTLAHVFAVTQPGNRRHEIYDVEVDFSDEACPVGFRKIGSTGREVDHYLLEMATTQGAVSIPIPGDVPDLATLVDEALRCFIPAQFEPQAWVSDHAVCIDDGHCTFNAVPALLKLDLTEVRAIFGGVSVRDLDFLAEGLPQRRAHSGPFDVRINQEDVVRMVCLLSGCHGALGENDSVQDITHSMWDDFTIAANQIQSIQSDARRATEPASIPRLIVDGNAFFFHGEPGGVTAVQTEWAGPFVDDAHRLAMTLMESQVLALYSSGVLWSKETGLFDHRVIEAVQASFDAIPRLIEDLDEQYGSAEKGETGERGN